MSEARRILLVGPEPPPFGGMAVQGQLLRERLGQAGLDVRFLPTNPRLPRALDLPVLRTLAGGLVFAGLLLARARRSRTVHVLGASGAYFLLRVLPVLIWARVLGAPCLVNYRGGLAESFLARNGWWARPALKLARPLTVPSAFLERIFAREGFAPRIVPNVMELERFPFVADRPAGLRVLGNRNFEPIYNVALLVEAFALVREEEPGALLTLAGTGSQDAALRAQVQAAGLGEAVRFTGRVERGEMPVLLAEHTVYANPTDVDNMPVSLLEAFASGLPVVSTDAGGVPDLCVHERHGLLVPRGDARALADAILRLHRDAELRGRLVRQAREHGDGFRWEAVLPCLLEAYDAAASRREARGGGE